MKTQQPTDAPRFTHQDRLDRATSLSELARILNKTPAHELADLDLDHLPTFGGEPIEATPGVFSWSANEVLVCDVAAGGEFEVVDR